jgi:hypothetical protein
MPSLRRPAAVLLLVVAGCALYSDVSITPLIVQPANIERGSDLQSMVRRADYVRAVEQASVIEAKERRSAAELAALGEAELIAARYDAARRHLRQALDLQPFRTTYANVAWDLSQLEYLTNNYEGSLDWARIAADHGLVVKHWHMQYLEAMSNLDVYRVSGPQVERVAMHTGRPDVPRIDIKVNKTRGVSAIVDSGAVLSIISRNFALLLPVRRLGTFEGTFSGLLGEPITVEFGILDSVQIGRLTIANVPVAIMPDDKMRFLVAGKKEFKMDFLLGANLLKEFRVDLDYRRSQAAFTHLTSADRRPAADQNLFMEQFRPVVRGTINRKGWYMFVLDTGSEVTFLNQTQLASLPIPLATPKVHNATLQGLGGARKRGEKVENVEIGIDKWGGVFRNIPMYEPAKDDPTSGIVGENFLKNFIVTIDFGRMRVDLQPLIRAVDVEESLQIPVDKQLPPP